MRRLHGSQHRRRGTTLTETRRDVVVVGAGPAGSMAARRLADRRHDVLLLEEHQDVGSPVHCTGLMGIEAFSEFDLPRDVILGEAASARFWSSGGGSVAASSQRLRPVIIDRAGLDRRLAASAEAAGVEVRRGCRAEQIAVDAAEVRIQTTGGVIRARSCVLACGASYRFHRTFGFGLPHAFLQSAQAEVPFPARPEIEVRFGRDVAPSGFAWLVPVTRGGVPHARIGLMSATRVRQRFTTLLSDLWASAQLDPVVMPAPRLKMLPLGPVARTYADRVLVVGDAAGLVKPTTGGGIHYSLLSGSLAAETLDEALRRDRLGASSLERYERGWRRRLGQEIRVGLAFRKMATRLSDESIDEIIELARVDGVIPLLQETATFNWHRKAAIALLGHPALRRIVLRSLAWRDTGI
jgi:geranylgeranyl reductase family protein